MTTDSTDRWSSPWWLAGSALVLLLAGGFLLAQALRPAPSASPDEVVTAFLKHLQNGEAEPARELLTSTLADDSIGSQRLARLGQAKAIGAVGILEGAAGDEEVRVRAELLMAGAGQPDWRSIERFKLQRRRGGWRIAEIENVQQGNLAEAPAGRGTGSVSAAPPASQPVRPAAPAAPAGAWTASQMAGQCMMVGVMEDWSPTNPAPLDTIAAGSVILYRRNINSAKGAEGVRRLCQQIREYVVQKHGVPAPLIAIDHEGGRVNRLRGIPGVVPYEYNGVEMAGKSVEEANKRAYLIGSSMGKSLHGLSIDLNLAPVVDVFGNPNNPDLGQRSYGKDPAFVSACATQFIFGLRQQGVLSCAKHWPGYGPIGENPHDDLARTKVTREDWSRKYLPPFKDAVAAGAETVMVGHVIYSFFGSDRPGSVDPKVYQTLREETGFEGLVMTDDLEMGGVVKLYYDNFGRCAVDAVAAGADMILVCHSPARANEAHRALAAEAKAGRLDLDTPAARLARLRGDAS